MARYTAYQKIEDHIRLMSSSGITKMSKDDFFRICRKYTEARNDRIKEFLKIFEAREVLIPNDDLTLIKINNNVFKKFQEEETEENKKDDKK